jgi:tRNA 2-thiocytidine biosynthesis protein TtcA
MASALQNVVPSHLMDRALFPFQTIRATGQASEDGDKAFDDEPLPMPAAPPAHAWPEPDAPGNAAGGKAVIPIASAH